MVIIQKWTGHETRALREARRMSIREFASRLGVSDRAVSKWEAGGKDFTPGPDSQAILDTFLRDTPDETLPLLELFLGGEVPESEGIKQEVKGISETVEQGHPSSVTHPVDGKLMTLICAGPFPSGPDNQLISLPDFYMDTYPVTNKEYAEFIKKTSYSAPLHWEDGEFPASLSEHPVVNVTHRNAQAYAEWAEKDLPSALQWEKSARGPEGSIFPWGNQETPAKCNVRQTGVRCTTPVDRYHSGVSYYDVYDLAGNVWEWCSTETDPGRFVLKGSAFTSPLAMSAGAAMNDASETMLDDDTGFRCVASLEKLMELLEIP